MKFDLLLGWNTTNILINEKESADLYMDKLIFNYFQETTEFAGVEFDLLPNKNVKKTRKF